MWLEFSKTQLEDTVSTGLEPVLHLSMFDCKSKLSKAATFVSQIINLFS